MAGHCAFLLASPVARRIIHIVPASPIAYAEGGADDDGRAVVVVDVVAIGITVSWQKRLANPVKPGQKQQNRLARAYLVKAIGNILLLTPPI